MNVNIILAGLEENNRDSVLKRIEFFKEGLRKEAFFCCLSTDEYGSEIDVEKTAIAFMDENPAEFTVFCGTYKGKELGKKVAAATGKACHTDVEYFEESEDGLKAVRKVYSTHMEKLNIAKDSVIILSAEGEKSSKSFAEEIKEFEGKIKDRNSNNFLIKEEKLPIIENLSEAKVVLLGGKGLGNKVNFERLEKLAEKMGVSCGSTRLAALSGWAGYDKIVGISGWSLNADVCIAFGVSGAGPLMQGIKGVGKLIAINNDKKAPIFLHADYGIEADCLEILEAMEKMAEQKGSVK